MREIVTLCIGNCGIKLGEKFWSSVLTDHGIDSDGIHDQSQDTTTISKAQLYGTDVLFNQDKNQTFRPRSIFVDFSPGSINTLRSGPLGSLFTSNYVYSKSDVSRNNWASGFYVDGEEVIEDIMTLVDKEVEMCDSIQGFQIIHSISGGTGAGLGSLVAKKLRDSVLPTDSSAEIVSPYNQVLTLHHLIESADITTLYDDSILCDRLKQQKYLGGGDTKKEISHNQLNSFIGPAINASTWSFRFPGGGEGGGSSNRHHHHHSQSMDKMYMNMVPYPRMHFLVSGLIDQQPQKQSSEEVDVVQVHDINSDFFNGNNFMLKPDPLGKYIGASFIYKQQQQGLFSQKDIDESLSKLESLHSLDFIPDCFKSFICNIPTTSSSSSSTSTFNQNNNNNNQNNFEYFENNEPSGIILANTSRYESMYRRRAFTSWYISQGMDGLEFEESLENVRDLISEYQIRSPVEDDEEEEEEQVHE
ncbi:hypothetical protein DFA_07049 [Cavenderia fasciculata]|uniref:Tubulin/FtsZ GTPase domain-containing protein n=1 Tax=Cavenderia fasciculata TaxID=261658 RepID=F4PVC7_CACFS|nr:uncharacterized protein DFA_07049 [Cavenderia fasciculata]EGG19941.1 hypothetical protein DFA_07049 [Cavenderia fasciculata]|eukprot:XP_004366924.1 hypothetical protein DFA_07049 [Cavenderia fasciculata]